MLDYLLEMFDKMVIVLVDELFLILFFYLFFNVVDSVNVIMGLLIKDLFEVDFFDYILDFY